MPLHVLIQLFYISGILAFQPWRKIMHQHCGYGMSTLAAGIGVTRALLTIGQLKRHCHQFEVRVITMHGVIQYLR
jgi:hypothetical protein